MGAAVDFARSELESQATGPPERGRLFLQIETWVDLLWRAGRGLTVNPAVRSIAIGPAEIPLDPALTKGLLSDDTFARRLELLVAEEGLRAVEEALPRFHDLLPLLVDAQLNEFSRRYLARVALLYLWGFEKEVFAFSRAVLDASFQELVPDERVKELKAYRKLKETSLHLRLMLARYSEPPLLSETTWRQAYCLKEDGNDVLHEDIEHHLHFSSALQAIEALRDVLHGLPRLHQPVILREIPSNACWTPKFSSGAG
jgi:hypothetical protein